MIKVDEVVGLGALRTVVHGYRTRLLQERDNAMFCRNRRARSSFARSMFERIQEVYVILDVYVPGEHIKLLTTHAFNPAKLPVVFSGSSFLHTFRIIDLEDYYAQKRDGTQIKSFYDPTFHSFCQEEDTLAVVRYMVEDLGRHEKVPALR